MPLPTFTDIAAKDERFKSLPPDKKLIFAERYWEKYAQENPDDIDYLEKQKADSLTYIADKAELEDAAPVQKRFIEAGLEATKFNLALRDGIKSGKINPDEAPRLTGEWELTQRERQDQAVKTANFFREDNSKTLGDLSALARDAAVFTPEKLTNKIGFSDRSTEEYKGQYESTRNAVAEQFGFKPEELDDVVKHQLDAQKEPVSRDAFGTVHIKNDVLFKGADEVKKAIESSNLPASTKAKQLNGLDDRLSAFEANVVETAAKNYPEYAQFIGLGKPQYPIEKPDAENDAWFKEHPETTGMAWGGGLNESDPKSPRVVILNPYSNLNDQQKEGVVLNEQIRHFMDEKKPKLNFEPTPEQTKFFEGSEYGKPENKERLKETLVARILTGDESAGNITPEQEKAAGEVWKNFNSKSNDFKKITDSLVSGVAENESTALVNGLRSSGVLILNALNKLPGSREDRSNLFASVADEVERSRKIDEGQLALSGEIQKDKLRFLGTTGGTVGSGVGSVIESAAVAYATGGLVPTLSGAGRGVAAANAALKVAPVATIFGARQGMQTYDQALKAGIDEKEATRLGVVSGLIEGGLTTAFSALGLGGIESIAAGATKEAVKKTASSAIKESFKALGKGVIGEELEENTINAVNAALVDSKINPNMTVEDFKQSVFDTTIATLLPSATISGVDAVSTYKQTNAELERRANAINSQEDLPSFENVGGADTTGGTPTVVDPATLTAEREAVISQAQGLPPSPERSALEERVAEIDSELAVVNPVTENADLGGDQTTPISSQPTDISTLDGGDQNTSTEIPADPVVVNAAPLSVENGQQIAPESIPAEPQPDTPQDLTTLSDSQLLDLNILPPPSDFTPEQRAAWINERTTKPNEGIKLYHGGLPENATLDSVDLAREGSQQNKRNRSYGGFYLTDETSRDWSESYAKERNSALHELTLKPDARILNEGDKVIDRINKQQREKLSENYDVIQGKDTLGRTQYILLNKDAVLSFKNVNSKQSAEILPNTPVTQQSEQISAPKTTPTDIPLGEERGVKFAITDKVRAKYGFTPREKLPSTTDAQDIVEAEQRISEARAYDEAPRSENLPVPKLVGQALLEDLQQTSRPADRVESALVAHELIRRENDLEKARADFDNLPADATAEQKKKADDKVTAANEALEYALNVDAVKGSQAGSALQARKKVMSRQFTLAKVTSDILRAKNSKSATKETLTDKERKEAQEIVNRWKEIEKREADLEAREADIIINELLKKAEADAKNAKKRIPRKPKAPKEKTNISETLRERIDNANARIAKRRGNLNAIIGIDPNLIDHAIVGVSYLRLGINNLADFTAQLVKDFGKSIKKYAPKIFKASQDLNAMRVIPKTPQELLEKVNRDKPLNQRLVYNLTRSHMIFSGMTGKEALLQARKDLQTVWPGITQQMVDRSFTGYGIQKFPTVDKLQSDLRELRQIKTLEQRLADIQAGVVQPKKGAAFKSEEVKELQEKIKAARKAAKIVVPKDPVKRDALKSIKTRINKDIAALENAIATQTAIPKRLRSVNYDAETLALKNRLKQARADYKAVFTAPKQVDKIKAFLKVIDRQIAEEDQMAREGVLKKPTNRRTSTPFSVEISERMRELDVKRTLRENAYAALYPKKSSEQRALEAATKSAEKTISKYEEIIATGNLPATSDRQLKFTPTQQLQVMWDTRNALSSAVSQMRRDTTRTGIAKTRAIRSAEKAIKDLERRIATKDFSARPKVDLSKNDPEVIAARKLRDDLKSTFNELSRYNSLEARIAEFEKTGKLTTKAPKTSPAGIKELQDRYRQLTADARSQLLLQKQMDELNDRIKRGDFSKKEKIEPVKSPERIALEFEKAKLETRFQQLKSDAAYSAASGFYKTARVGRAILQFRKLVLLGLDVALFRQGIVSFARAPLKTTYRLGQAIANFKESDAFAIYNSLQDPKQNPNAKYWNNIPSFKLFSPLEEGFANKEDILDFEVLDKIEKIPGLKTAAGAIKAIERVNRTLHNLLATDMFNALAATNDSLTNDQIALYSNAAMKTVARGDFKNPDFDKGVQLANTVLLSTRYYLARAALVVGSPVWSTRGAFRNTGSARTKIAYQLYGKVLFNSAVLMTALGYGFMDDEERKKFFDPTSSSFGVFKAKGFKYEILSSIRPFINIIAKTVLGTKEGKALRGEGVNSFKGDLKSEWKSFVENRMNINLKFLTDVIAGSFFGNKPVTTENTLLELMGNLNAKTDFKILTDDKLSNTEKGVSVGLVHLGLGVDEIKEKEAKTKAVGFNLR